MGLKKQTRNFSDHPGLRALLPHYSSYAVKGLAAFRSEKHRFHARLSSSTLQGSSIGCRNWTTRWPLCVC